MREQFDRLLVTAALPYANGKIHLGHLAGAYLPADIYVRYYRSAHPEKEILFICGSDEHGVPITITADQEHVTPQAIVDRYHALNKAAFEKFGMSFDMYSRTSLPLHHDTAKEFFLKLHGTGVLKEKKEKQLFDEKANMFLPDRYVEGTCPVCQNAEARGDQCEKCGTYLSPADLINPKSKITGNTPTVRETSHWYFPLGDFQDRLRVFIAERNKRDGWKENVLRYCESWFREGLADRAVTRDLQWGVRVPLKGYEDKVLYVWFDAVLGYISGTKEWSRVTGDPQRWRDFWLHDSTKYVAFIGKDNVVFHCIVFPAMLMAWNDAGGDRYVLPENVPANEFLNFEGQKFSKSRGWGIDVDEFLENFPADALRYTLTMNLPEARDADFYWKDFQARNNNELADILGNFVNRTMTFAHRYFKGRIPESDLRLSQPGIVLKQMLETESTSLQGAGELIEKYKFRDAALRIMNVARYANKFFDVSKPWETVESNNEQCATTINLCLQTIRSLAILFEPIIPSASARMWKMLNLEGTPSKAGWRSAGELALKAGHQLGTPEILFTKIEDEVIENQIRKLPGIGSAPSPKASVPKPTVTIDDFTKIDFRVAKVIAAELVPKSNKLIKLQISLGGETRQVVAGIARHYKPEDLVGKKVIVVANLAPAKLMGQESQGMLLAASDAEGNLSIITLEKDMGEGSIVK